MADLNITYHAFKPQYDIDAIKTEVLYDWLPDNVKSNVDKFLSDIITLNNQQSITESAVKLPYQGSTSDDRNKWLVDRIEAVYNRLDFIRLDAEDNRKLILDLGGEPSPDTFQVIGTVLSIIPATRPVGVVTSVIGKLVNSSNDNQAYRQNKINEANARIAGYSQDISQLGLILKQLTTELATAPSGTSVSYGAGTVIPVWYYYVGIAVVILFLMYLKNKRKKR